MGYISGMAMGNIIQRFLEERNIYNPENYKSAYNACKMRCHKISSGNGKATRHRYYDSEIEPILIDWYKQANSITKSSTCSCVKIKKICSCEWVEFNKLVAFIP